MRKSRGLTGGGWILWFHFSEPLRYPAESCSVNHTIKRIVNSYNADERLNAAREGRTPFLVLLVYNIHGESHHLAGACL